MKSFRSSLSTAGLFAFFVAFTASLHAGDDGHPCNWVPYDIVMPPGPVLSNCQDNCQYGRAIATEGNWLFVGSAAPSPGAVHVFEIENGVYVHRQMLQPPDLNEPAGFGASIDAHGDQLIIGMLTSGTQGSAHIFQRNGDQWVHQQRLTSFAADVAYYVGESVAIRDDLALVSARHLMQEPAAGKGAVYIYHRSNNQWFPLQRLTNDAPAFADYFGSALAISDSTILVGCPRATAIEPAVFVFEHDGSAWMPSYKLTGTGTGATGFASQMALDGEILVAGGATGNEAIYTWNGDAWNFAFDVLPSDGNASGDFGAAVALMGDKILIASPLHAVSRWQTQVQAGAVYAYTIPKQSGGRNESGVMYESLRLELIEPSFGNGYGPYSLWLTRPQPLAWGEASNLHEARLGLSLAISPLGFLASSRLVRPPHWDYLGHAFTGAVNLFEFEPPLLDCDNNSIHDSCEIVPDQNANHLHDACDIASGYSTDCNANSLPDETETSLMYKLSPLTSGQAWCMGANEGNSDFIWLNQYRVKSGGETITHIGIGTHRWLPRDVPVTVMVYRDPDNDGDPSNGILLSTATTVALNSETGFNHLLYVPLDPTFTGPPGSVIFIGAALHTLHLNSSHAPWCGPLTAPSVIPYQRSWRAAAPPGQGNIQNLSANSYLTPWTQDVFVLNAISNDCNQNGTPDMCDISSGTSVDANANGIPDECETPFCNADVAPFSLNGPGDGAVNVADLLQVITGWGACNPCYTYCAGDTNDDCRIDVADILAIIQQWGPCP